MHIENLTTHLTYKSWAWCKTVIFFCFCCMCKICKERNPASKERASNWVIRKDIFRMCAWVCVKAASEEWKHNQSHTMKPCWWEKAATHLVGRSDSLVLNIRAVSKEKRETLSSTHQEALLIRQGCTIYCLILL